MTCTTSNVLDDSTDHFYFPMTPLQGDTILLVNIGPFSSCDKLPFRDWSRAVFRGPGETMRRERVRDDLIVVWLYWRVAALLHHKNKYAAGTEGCDSLALLMLTVCSPHIEAPVQTARL